MPRKNKFGGLTNNPEVWFNVAIVVFVLAVILFIVIGTSSKKNKFTEFFGENTKCNNKAGLDALNNDMYLRMISNWYGSEWQASDCNPHIEYYVNGKTGMYINGDYIFNTRGSKLSYRRRAYKAAVDAINIMNQWDKNPQLHIPYLILI